MAATGVRRRSRQLPGRDAYAAWFEALRETWSSIRLTPTLWDVGDRHVVAEVRAENIGRASDAPINQLFWIVHTMDEGKIVRLDSFTSEAEALEAVGLRE